MLKLYGRTFPQSRQIAAYGTEPDMALNYSGSEITIHHPYPPVLARMQERLEELLGVRFNHCMLNRYDDGGVMIG
jgi:alkylated DNA repair dioxygenase AlkB